MGGDQKFKDTFFYTASSRPALGILGSASKIKALKNVRNEILTLIQNWRTLGTLYIYNDHIQNPGISRSWEPTVFKSQEGKVEGRWAGRREESGVS